MKINPRALLIREAIKKIVPMLTDRKVEVTSQGTSAFVKYHPTKGHPVQVNVPYIADEASNELLDAIQGFLDHEVGHVLFTDFDVLKKAQSMGIARMHNIVEDPFVEGQMSKRFTGSASNLTTLHHFFLKEVIEPNVKKASTSEEFAAALMVPMVRAWAGQSIYKDFMSDKWHLVEDIVKSIGSDIPGKVADCKSSADCLAVADELRKALKAVEPTPGPPKPGKPKKGKPVPKGKKEEEPPKDEDGEEEGEESPGDGDPSEGDDGDDGSEFKSGDDDDEEAEQEEAKFDDSGAGEKRSGEGEKVKGKGSSPAMTEGNTEEFAASEEDAEEKFDKEAFEKAFEESPEFDESVAKALSDEALAVAKNAAYKIFTTDDDTVETVVVSDKEMSAEVRRMTDSVDTMVGPMQKDIERAMAAISASVWVPGYKSGRLQGAALVRTAFGRDDVFRRKQESRSKDVAVELVVDCSGSMNGAKIFTACQAAYALTSVLDRIGIANEVIGFTTKFHPRKTMTAMIEEAARLGMDHERYSRTEALYMPVFKHWNERVTPLVKRRFVEAFDYGGTVDLRNNVDGECVLLAARRLAARRETRKVMIVFSDGNPACSGDMRALRTHLKLSVEKIEKEGIDVLGMGIMDESVKSFYKKYVVLSKLDELPGEVMRRIKKVLIV